MTRRLLVPVAALALSVALGACGSSGSSAGAAATAPTASATTAPNGAPTTAAGAAQFEAYTDCLSQHGVTIPPRTRGSSVPTGAAPSSSAPGGAGRGGFGLNTNDPTVQAAMQACASLRPQFTGQGGGGGGFGPGGAQRTQQFQAYLSCLSDNGVTVPSTTVTSTQPPTTAPTGTDGQAGGQRGARGGGLQAVLAQVRNDPNFATANAKCGVLLPQGGGAPGATTTTTTVG
jgi:hypothetical protein